jgi:hypothetical protein
MCIRGRVWRSLYPTLTLCTIVSIRKFVKKIGLVLKEVWECTWVSSLLMYSNVVSSNTFNFHKFRSVQHVRSAEFRNYKNIWKQVKLGLGLVSLGGLWNFLLINTTAESHPKFSSIGRKKIWNLGWIQNRFPSLVFKWEVSKKSTSTLS